MQYISFRSAAIAAAIVVLLHLALVAVSKTNGNLLAVEDGFVTLTGGLSAAALFYTGFRTAGRIRKAWMVIAAAMLFNTLGDISWSIMEVILHQEPFPSVADIGYLMFYPLFALGIFLLPDAPLSSREKIKILLDAAIVIVSVALVFWVLLIGPIVISIQTFDWAALISLAYPVMDLVLFIALIELLFKKLAYLEHGPIILLAAGCATQIFTDSIFSIRTQNGTFVSGDILDSGWVISYLLLGLAGILQTNISSSNQPLARDSFQNRRVNWTQNVPFLGIGAVFLLFVWGQEFSQIINYSLVSATFALIIGLMFIRQKVVFDENNEFLAMNLAETAERSRAEEALRDSEKEKGAILGGLKKVAVIYLDTQMRIIWVNSPVRDRLGIPEEEIKGKRCYKILQGIDRPCEDCTAIVALKTGQSQEGELITPNEKTWLSRSSPIKNEDDKVTGVVHVALNISDRKKAESSLKESERLLASIIDFLPDATVVIDKEGKVISWNQSMEKMTGVKSDQILGKGDYEYAIPFYGERRPTLINAVRGHHQNLETKYKAIKELEDHTLAAETYIPNLRGNETYLLGSASALYDSEGNYWGAIETIRDITERKHAEEDLERAKERAESATLAKTEFLANMSHEIRTPMNAIIGMTGLLLDENLTQNQKQDVEIIRRSGDTLLTIINNILDLTKIEAGMMELERQSFNLRDCLEVSLDMVAIDAKKKGLVTEYAIEDSVPTMILGDPTRINQILINLLNNAVKFTEKGGIMITVSGSMEDSGNCKIHFAVTDTGIGIPEDKKMNLFESFRQVDASTARRYGGSGLGLAISKRLAEMMGGEIWVESVSGTGSTFHFTIVAEPTSFDAIEIDHPASTVEMQEDLDKNLSILLAEDNLINQIVTQKMLSKLGYRSDVAANGFEVLQALERQHYDVVLMDVQMPEMDGLEAARVIRQRWADEKRPVIVAMTASALKGDREECLAAGMDDYVSKPVKIEMLRTALEACSRVRHHTCENKSP
ncbi:MAG: ATP-binding protein [Methanothrix sp.]|nr:ATP-binding protein [Methanothrix sp.]